MSLNVLRLQDPVTKSPHGERRRRVRHRLHTPVYASFGEPGSGMVRDLSELLDIHEEGFAVQTSERLELNRPVTISLDLTETKTYIHVSGHVVWSDGSGRGGIHFATLPAESQNSLREWLFSNLLIAFANHEARAAQLANHATELPPPLLDFCQPPLPDAPPDLSAVLAAVESVRRELRERNEGFDADLQWITEQTLRLTGATGAALAFLSNDAMICRARSGAPAPPIGTRVDASHGFSGECIRGGRPICCVDTETDPRVDRETCRVLGIGSILAAPILSNFRVVGLIEVFSPRPHAFSKTQEIAVDRLAEIVPKEPVAVSPALLAAPELQTASDAGAVGSALTPALPLPGTALHESLDLDPSRSSSNDGLSLHESPERESSSRESSTQEYPNWELPNAMFPRQAPPDYFPDDLSDDAEFAHLVPSRSFHIGLLLATVAFAALASGYVLAPTIQKYWFAVQPAPRSAATSAAPNTAAPAPLSSTSVDQLRTRAAESDDPQAQYELGLRYHSGDGVKQSDSEAMKWFTRAAENGNVPAQNTLGAYYWAGRGIPQDLSKAYFWSVLARAQGDEASKYRVAVLTSQLTRSQTASIQQEADAWIRQHTRGTKPEGN